MDIRSTSQSNAGDEGKVITRACDACRRKKIRCEPTQQGCAQCTRFRTECHFTPIATKRKPRRPPGFKYIARLEQRLVQVEGLLAAKPLEDLDVPRLDSRAVDAIYTPPLDLGEYDEVTNDQASLMALGGPQFTSRVEAGVLDLSPRVAKRFTNHGNFEMPGYLRNATIDRPSSTLWPQPQPAPLIARPQLPSKGFALELVLETLTNYNRFLPLFDENDFLSEFHHKYSTSSSMDAGWWACLNVVLSIGHRLRALRTSDTTNENYHACAHVQHALDVVSELNVANLSAVQALVGMACILQGTPNSEPAAMLVAAALRLAQAMNLHRESSNAAFSEQEAEKRRRVFWKVYVLDKDISLRTRRPFGQDDEDMDVRLPSNTGLDSCDVDLFKSRIALAMIQGQVYKQLYSVRAERQTEAARAVAAQELSSLLSFWESSAQMDSPEGSKISSAGHVAGEMIHKVVLRLTYMHCLTMIDRHLPSTTTRVAYNQVLGSFEVSPSPGIVCLTESRKAIRLVEAIPEGDSSCVWMLLHAFLAAATGMLRSITQDPLSPTAQSDLQLVQPFVRLLGRLARGSGKCSWWAEIERIHRSMSTLNSEAQTAVHLFTLESSAHLALAI